MKRASRKSESGVVLIAVLSGILILTLVALALTSSVRVGVEELGNRKEHLQAYFLARGGVFTTAALLTAVSPTPKEGLLEPGQGSVEWEERLGRVKVEITDERGKIDLNQAPEQVLERLLVALGANLQSANTLAKTIKDWRSPGSLTRWNKATASGEPVPFDRSQLTGVDYRSVEELLQVPGVSPELFYGHYVRRDDGKIVRQPGLIDCVTVDSRSTQININYAPYPVLLVVAGTEPRVAEYIAAARQKKPFNSLSELTNEFPASLSGEALSSLTTQSGDRFTLLASAWTRGGIVARIQAVVELHGQTGSYGPVQILRWKDFYAQ